MLEGVALGSLQPHQSFEPYASFNLPSPVVKAITLLRKRPLIKYAIYSSVGRTLTLTAFIDCPRLVHNTTMHVYIMCTTD